MRNALLALPLLAACALHAQDATVTPTTGRVLTLTAQVTIPENPQGVLLSLRTSSDNAFDLYLNGNQENNAGFYIYAGDDARPTSAFNNQTFTLPPGSKTLTFAYATAGENAPVEGVRLWVDGTLAYADAGLKWSENGEYATRIVIGADVRTTPTKLEGLVVEGSPTLVEGSVPNPAPRLSANAGSFTAPGANLDGSVTIAAAPISLNGVSANTFSVTLDAELPEGTNGALIGWQVKKDNNTLYTGQAERNADGEPLRHSGTTTITTDPKQSPSNGRHIWTLTYDGSSDGARLYEDGTLIAHAEGLKWRNTTTNVGFPAIQITIGDSVSDQPGPLEGLKVYAVHVTMGSATPPENAMTALYDVPEALAGVGEAALYHLMTQNGRVGDFTVPAVTLNGETLGAADAARALWLFDKTGPFAADTSITLTWGIADLSVASSRAAIRSKMASSPCSKRPRSTRPGSAWRPPRPTLAPSPSRLAMARPPSIPSARRKKSKPSAPSSPWIPRPPPGRACPPKCSPRPMGRVPPRPSSSTSIWTVPSTTSARRNAPR